MLGLRLGGFIGLKSSNMMSEWKTAYRPLWRWIKWLAWILVMVFALAMLRLPSSSSRKSLTQTLCSTRQKFVQGVCLRLRRRVAGGLIVAQEAHGNVMIPNPCLREISFST